MFYSTISTCTVLRKQNYVFIVIVLPDASSSDTYNMFNEIQYTIPPKSGEHILQHISHSYCFLVVAVEPNY